MKKSMKKSMLIGACLLLIQGTVYPESIKQRIKKYAIKGFGAIWGSFKNDVSDKLDELDNPGVSKAFLDKLSKVEKQLEKYTPSERLIILCKRAIFEGGRNTEEFDAAVKFLDEKATAALDNGADVSMRDASGNTAYVYLKGRCERFDQNMEKIAGHIESTTGLEQEGWKQNYDWAKKCSARLRDLLSLLVDFNAVQETQQDSQSEQEARADVQDDVQADTQESENSVENEIENNVEIVENNESGEQPTVSENSDNQEVQE